MPVTLVKDDNADYDLWKLCSLIDDLSSRDVTFLNPVWLNDCRWKLNKLCYRTGMFGAADNDIIATGHNVDRLCSMTPEQLNVSVEHNKKPIDAAQALFILADLLVTKAVELQNAKAAL